MHGLIDAPSDIPRLVKVQALCRGRLTRRLIDGVTIHFNAICATLDGESSAWEWPTRRRRHPKQADCLPLTASVGGAQVVATALGAEIAIYPPAESQLEDIDVLLHESAKWLGDSTRLAQSIAIGPILCGGSYGANEVAPAVQPVSVPCAVVDVSSELDLQPEPLEPQLDHEELQLPNWLQELQLPNSPRSAAGPRRILLHDHQDAEDSLPAAGAARLQPMEAGGEIERTAAVLAMIRLPGSTAEYVVIKKSLLCVGSERESAECGELLVGTVIAVLETLTLHDGTVRMRCDRCAYRCRPHPTSSLTRAPYACIPHVYSSDGCCWLCTVAGLVSAR